MFLLHAVKKGCMVDMKGKLCIVTGANSGIGYHTTKGLATMNATVVMVVRDLDKGQKAFDKIKNATGSNSLYLMHCDLSSMKSVDRFSHEFSNRFTCLHVLINNAGTAFSKRQETEEGFEKTIATNYFGMFKLTKNLLPLLKEFPPSRIINLGSGMHKTGKIDWDDFMFEKKFKGMHVYATTKLMVSAYTYALAKRLEGTGVSANVVEPGFVATNLGANMGSLRDRIAFTIVRPMQISAKRGAETSIWAATNPDLENVSGKTFSKKSETETAAITYDKEFQERLWENTVKLLML
jgi:NAD(P)-dependent dehydrogenase (short-subunit alcohol dehydrogenase family)